MAKAHVEICVWYRMIHFSLRPDEYQKSGRECDLTFGEARNDVSAEPVLGIFVVPFL